MIVENWFKVIEMLIALWKVSVWPISIVLIVMYFRAPLKQFIENLSELSFKAGGVEASAKRRQIEAAAFIGAALEKQSKKTAPELVSVGDRLRQITDIVAEAITPKFAGALSNASILWVDDRPQNNIYERRSMEALGIHFTISTSTENALENLRDNRYSLIISDMDRPPDHKAGYTLLEQVRRLGDKTLFFIYAGSNAPEHKIEAARKGAQGSTNDPQELFQMVVNAIVRF